MNDTAGDTVLIIGCGDVGRRLGQLEKRAGRSVIALARSISTASAGAALGFRIVLGDLDVTGSLSALPPSPKVLYYLAPPPSVGVTEPRLTHLLRALTRATLPERVVYISTSGVYGDCQGAWIDESWPLNPCTDRARRRVEAERLLQVWGTTHAIPVCVLRVPGIYGPGRIPAERIRQGIPVIREQESPYSNRIHADDLATACAAAAHLGKPGRAYNVSDGHPSTMTDYFFKVADLLGLPRPPTITLEQARRVLSPAMLSFLGESKRLKNQRMLEELNIRLRHPNLASGLAASIENDPELAHRQIPAPPRARG